MARISKFRSLSFGVLLLSVLGASCAPALTSELTSVNLRFVDGSAEISSSLSATSSGLRTSGSALKDAKGTDIALSGDYCYGIMVSASDTPSLNRFPNAVHNKDNGGSTDPNKLLCQKYQPQYIGQVNGLFKIGDDAELKIPVGKARMFLMIMMKKGENGISSTCSGALDVRYTAADDTNIYIDNVMNKNADVKFLAFGQSDLKSGANTVDMQLLNGADGLECDDGGGDNGNQQLQTIPYTDNNGMLHLSNNASTGFITVECPKGGYKVLLESSDKSFSKSRLCYTEDNTFVGLAPGKTYTASVFDSGGGLLSNYSKTFSVSADMYSAFNVLTDTTANHNPAMIPGGASIHAVALRNNALVTVSNNNELKVNPASLYNMSSDPNYTSYNYMVTDDASPKAPQYDTNFPNGSFTTGAFVAGLFNTGADLIFPIFQMEVNHPTQFSALGTTAQTGFSLANPTSFTNWVGMNHAEYANNTAKLFALYAEGGSSQSIYPSGSVAFAATTIEHIDLPRIANLNALIPPIFLRTDTDGVPMIFAPLQSTSTGNAADDADQAEIFIFRCPGAVTATTSGCVDGTNKGTDFFRLQFRDTAMSVLTPYQIVPYTRSNNNGSETRVLFAHTTTDTQQVMTISVSTKNMSFQNQAADSRRRIDTRGTDADLEFGTFYPALGSDPIYPTTVKAIVSFDNTIDFPSNYDKAWNEQLLLWASAYESGAWNDVLYRSPDGGRNWFKVYDALAAITGIIAVQTPYLNTNTTPASVGYSPSFLITEYDSTSHSAAFLMMQGYGF